MQGTPSLAGDLAVDADEVVCFEPVFFTCDDPQGTDELLEVDELANEFVGHGLPISLVLFEHLVAIGRCLAVEEDTHVLWLKLLDDGQQHRRGSQNRSGGDAGGGAEMGHGEKSPVQNRTSIDKHYSVRHMLIVSTSRVGRNPAA